MRNDQSFSPTKDLEYIELFTADWLRLIEAVSTKERIKNILTIIKGFLNYSF